VVQWRGRSGHRRSSPSIWCASDLTGLPQNPCNEKRLSAFRQTLAERGWAEGRNLRIDYRFAGGDPDLLRKYAAELVGSQPNVVMAVGSGAVASLRQSSRAVPIIFAQVIDPVGGGFVEGLAQPAAMPPDFCCTSTATLTYLEAIVPLAARFRLPAAYSDRDFVAGGGLLSYGPDIIDLAVRPTTSTAAPANALGLTIPETLLATADEVIE
jgi:ABC transporter substrate binding protein